MYLFNGLVYEHCEVRDHALLAAVSQHSALCLAIGVLGKQFLNERMKLGHREGKGECLLGALFMTSWHSPVQPDLLSSLVFPRFRSLPLCWGLESFNQQTFRKVEQRSAWVTQNVWSVRAPRRETALGSGVVGGLHREGGTCS